ncbi:Uncharacterised protein [Mycobacteroides abscessus subsp. abscessus]|nr:Uncharacterised protein [Mycobacteroides abscessus subsp. abscessus]
MFANPCDRPPRGVENSADDRPRLLDACALQDDGNEADRHHQTERPEIAGTEAKTDKRRSTPTRPGAVIADRVARAGVPLTAHHPILRMHRGLLKRSGGSGLGHGLSRRPDNPCSLPNDL